MSLRFIYGRAGSGKSYFVTESIKKSLDKAKNNNIILLVPEQFSFQSEKNLINKIGSTGISNVNVLSFKTFAKKVFTNVGGIAHKRMNNAGKCMLIYKVMNDLKDKLKIYNTSIKQQGFAKIMSDLITEFKNYNITPEILLNSTLHIEDEFLQKKIKDIAFIYDEFQNKLNENYIDPEDYLTMLYYKIDEYDEIDNSEIWVDEFNYFTPQQYKILEKLFKKAKRVNITLCTNTTHEKNNQNGIFDLVKVTEDKILKIVRENNISIEKPIELYKRPYPRFKNSREISYLEENLFNYNSKEYVEKINNLNVFKAKNLYSEIEYVAKDIIRLCRDNNYRFKEIAVVSRDLTIYEAIIKAVFSEYEIPCFIDKKKDISNNPLIVLLKSSIEIFTKNWSYQSVFRYLKTGLLNIENDDICILENYVLEFGIKGKNKWVKDELWNYVNKDEFDKNEDEYVQKLNKINEIRFKVSKPLSEFYNNIKQSKKAIDICGACYNFLCSINIPEKIESLIEKFKLEGNQQIVREYSAIWNLVIEILDQVVDVVGEESLSLDEFVKIITIGFQENKIGLIPPSLDQVLVSSADRIKSHDIKALYLIGANDGVFPKGNWDEGVFSDLDRINLLNSGVELGKNTKVKAFEEQFLIYTTLTIASNYISISYSVSNYEGKALRPSMIISRINKMYKNINKKNNILDENDNFDVYRQIPTFNELVTTIRKDKNFKQTNLFWQQVYLWYKNNEYWNKICDKVFQGFYYNNQTKKLNEESVRKLYGKNIRMSVSRLEKYIQCPFGYYIQYGLNAKERKIFKFNAPNIGTFMHNVIEEFSNKVMKDSLQWKDLTEEWCKQNVDDCINSVIEKSNSYILNNSSKYKYFIERLKNVILKSIELIVLHMRKSNFVPIGYEIKFGKDGDFPAIQISLETGENIELIGKIDRVDKLECDDFIFYRVIDYKSGNKDFKLSDVYYGLQVQLITYLGAIINGCNSKNQKALPGGMLYFKLDDPIISGSRNLTDSQIQEEILKQLKMKGLILSEESIIKNMDKDFNKKSEILPVELKKDGTFSLKSSIATMDQFFELMEHVKEILVKSCKNMFHGDISIVPYKKSNENACNWCQFSAICQFDTSISNNKYKIINNLTNKEVWQQLDDQNNSSNRK